MLKTMTYQEKFVLLKRWIPEIIDQVKKDLKQDHLKRDIGFLKQFFPSNKNPNKIDLDELIRGYSAGLANNDISNELGEFIANRWLLKNTELYYFFEESLKKITSAFEDIEELDIKFATPLAEEACQLYGPIKVYLFTILNSVVFPKAIIESLQKKAEEEHAQKGFKEEENQELKSWLDKEKKYLTQIDRLEDKYEKKILGLQRKYHNDIESLKKQIANLQKKVFSSKKEYEAVPIPVKPSK